MREILTVAIGTLLFATWAVAQTPFGQPKTPARVPTADILTAEEFHEQLMGAYQAALAVRERGTASRAPIATALPEVVALYDAGVSQLLEADPSFRQSAQGGLQSLTESEGGSSSNERIFFGEATGAFNSVVALYHAPLQSKRRFVCSGVLLHDQVVLTAAHCLCNANTNQPQSVDTVYLIDGREWKKPGPYKVADATALAGDPEEYCGARHYKGRDLALLLLESVVQFRFDRANMIPWDRLPSFGAGWIVGYGLNEGGPRTSFLEWQGNLYSKERRVAQVAVATAFCNTEISGQVAKDYYGCYEGRELVAGDFRQHRRDACIGDSGGPLFAGSFEEHWVAAVVSRSVTRNVGKMCGPGTIYTPLDEANQAWISRCIGALLRKASCDAQH
jgi:hypothetical protein